MKLYIGNKKYSSWSMRPWLGLRAKNIEFEEILVQFDMKAGNPEFRKFSPTGKVPCLVDQGVTIWESLAILEYAAEKFPEAGLWPEDLPVRAVARSVAHEMHGGFSNLRNECPMNLARTPSRLSVSDKVISEVARVETIWQECLETYGGPFLFGEFSIADAMYAPVVNRLEIYCLAEKATSKTYSTTMKNLEAWKEWEIAGLAEPWIVEEDEV